MHNRTAMNKNPAGNYFVHTLKERKGTVAIILLILIFVFASQYLYPLIISGNNVPPNEISAGLDSLRNKDPDSSKNTYRDRDFDSDRSYSGYKNYNKAFSGTMFYFDPNTLDAAGWARLGIREKTIAGIQKYISKGGRFRDAEALRKIWGLSEPEKDRLVPYVRIAGLQSGSAGYTGYANSNHSYQPYEKKVYEKKTIAEVDINSGDSSSFEALPGIGPGFAGRIIKFRNKLGGFYKVEQVGEVFGLPDSTFQKIRPLLKISGENIRKININTATNEELKAHPYIRWQLAGVILEYRKQHGNFKYLEDLKKIMIINDETYNKMAPYLNL